MLVEWYEYESGGVEKRPETYEVYALVFMIQNGFGNRVVRVDSLEKLWNLWHSWRKL